MGSIWSGSRFAPPLWMPPRPADTTTEEQSPKHVANWHLLGIKMTRTTSSQCLQSYFRRMQHVMARICHPLSIHSEACSIIDSVKNAGIANPSKWLAERLFIAGVVRLEYTRTVALLIHCVLIELNMTDWRVMGVHLEKFATATLLNVFYNFSGDSTFTPNATGLEKADDGIRDRQFNVAALYGDLVSLGIISHSVLVSVMNHFLGCISSISQYRVIYLLVLRATFQPAFPIYPGCLLGWQNMLLFPMRIGLRIDDKIVQRWIIVSIILSVSLMLICLLLQPGNLQPNR